MSMLWGCKFGNPSLLLIAQKLADVANDDGTSIYPANETVADAVGCSERSVQRYKKLMQESGLLVLVKEGGFGPKDTSEYRYDLHILQMLHHRDFSFDELLFEARACQKRRELDPQTDEEQQENKGDSLSPLKSGEKVAKGDTGGKLRVTPVVNKGDTAVSPDSSLPILNTPTQDAREVKSLESGGMSLKSVCVSSGFVKLSQDQQRVGEYFIDPLARSLTLTERHSPEMLADMAADLSHYSSAVFDLAKPVLRKSRSVFPSISQADKVCREVAPQAFRQCRIERGSPEWEVWGRWSQRNGSSYALKNMARTDQIAVDASMLADLMEQEGLVEPAESETSTDKAVGGASNGGARS